MGLWVGSLPGILAKMESASSWTTSSLLFPPPADEERGWTSRMVPMRVIVSCLCFKNMWVLHSRWFFLFKAVPNTITALSFAEKHLMYM